MATNNEIMYQARMEELSLKVMKLEAENKRLNNQNESLMNQANQLNQKLTKVIGVAQEYVPQAIMLEFLNELITDTVNQLMASD